mgnify:CR=1 FL=1
MKKKKKKKKILKKKKKKKIIKNKTISFLFMLIDFQNITELCPN